MSEFQVLFQIKDYLIAKGATTKQLNKLQNTTISAFDNTSIKKVQYHLMFDVDESDED
ncbi:MAG: hypothetical protein ACPGSL_05330 [Vicingaceae bacterium]